MPATHSQDVLLELVTLAVPRPDGSERYFVAILDRGLEWRRFGPYALRDVAAGFAGELELLIFRVAAEHGLPVSRQAAPA